MIRKSYKITAQVTYEDGTKENITLVQTNTSIIGAIKDAEYMSQRSGIRDIEIIKVINLRYI